MILGPCIDIIFGGAQMIGNVARRPNTGGIGSTIPEAKVQGNKLEEPYFTLLISSIYTVFVRHFPNFEWCK